MNKPKPDIYWLPEEQYKKALYHFRSQVAEVLNQTFDMYGMDIYIPGATTAIEKLAEDFTLVCRGVDKPIKTEYKSPTGRTKK
jgi:hypothetical protein